MRVSDAEREAAAAFLKRHYALGRLTQDELADRVDAAYRARTRSQLVAMTRDLPPLDHVVRPARRLAGLGAAMLALATLLAVIAVLAAMPSEMAVLFVVIALPMLVMLGLMLLPLVLATLGILWLARALGRVTGRSVGHRQLRF